jgi:choline kinase
MLGAAADLPKALVPVLGRPLLSYTLDGLAGAGVQQAYVVVGHRADQVVEAVAGIETPGLAVDFVRNPRYESPNGSSLAAARDAVQGGPFLLLMADHLLSSAAIRRMLAASGDFAVGVNHVPLPSERLVDATRVRLRRSGLVEAFGKRLDQWDAIDAGIFSCLPAVFETVDALGEASEVGAIMTAVAARFRFRAIDLAGTFWLDVDTPADLAEAERLLAG